MARLGRVSALRLVVLVALVAWATLTFPSVEAKKGGSQQKLADLRSLSSDAKDGLLMFDKSSDLLPFLEGKERPYALVVSVRLMDRMLKNEGVKTQKHATSLDESLRAAIKKYRGSVPKGEEEVFFVSLEYNQDTQDVFEKFEIQSFPTTVVVTRNHKVNAKDATFRFTQDARFTQSNKKDLFDFLEDVLALGVFDTKDDQKVSVSVFNIVFGYGVIILAARVLWFFSQRGFLVPLMAVGSIVVFWVSTSGLIKCIIHNLPMVVADRNGNPQVFISDNRQQTITEGIVMSSCYLVIAFAISSFTYVGKTFVESNFKSAFLWATFVVGTMTYAFVMDTFQWKTHMQTMIYGFNL